MGRARTLPRRPIVSPPEPIVGAFLVTRINFDQTPFKSVTLELQSHGPITINRLPTNYVDLVEQGTATGRTPFYTSTT